MEIKERFFEIVEEIKKTGIAEKLCKTSCRTQLRETWAEFMKENLWLFNECDLFAFERHYIDNSFFKKDDKIENPIEIAIAIKLIGIPDFEEEIFEDDEILYDEIEKINSDFTNRISKNLRRVFISELTAKSIFPVEYE